MSHWKNKMFQKIHQNNLIYNTCWEDPRCDRELMNFNRESKIMMITSAGCNALEYLLDDPQSIDCVDLNFRQNALLALKVAFFKKGEYDLLFRFFGQGRHPKAESVYKSAIRPDLDPAFRGFWDQKIHFFSGKGLRSSFYFKGTSGLLAWSFKKYLFLRPQLKRSIHRVMNSMDLHEQSIAYQQASAFLYSSLFGRLMTHPLALSLAGVPQAQAALFPEDWHSQEGGYIKYSFDKVFYELPIQENYFYSVYWNGQYESNRCPEYLKEHNFQTIKERVNRIQWHTASITDFLSGSDRCFSHFILLDHMDWLAKHQPAELLLEWNQVFSASAKKASVLFRSAALSVDWLPSNVLDQLEFDRKLARAVHKKDRVGTYASVWKAQIRNDV
jgi:S-adenosylmethionine-diacylglycerol 3-amino-3-carboxypropyl transferase